MHDGSAGCDNKMTFWPRLTSEANLIVKAIQKNDFLSRLDDEQTAMMVDLLAVSSFKLGDQVIKEGTEGDSMYIVAGEATRQVWRAAADGRVYIHSLPSA